MSAAGLLHPPRGLLVACAAPNGQGVGDVASVRRHVDEDRCESCSSILFRMLNSRRELSRDCAYSAEWIQPKTVTRARGRRSGAAADYQVVCGVGPFELDVLVRDCEDERTLNYVGQVTLADHVEEPAVRLPVRLVGVPLPQSPPTATNDFGEFALASGRAGIYGLKLGEGADAPCVVVWEGWTE